ncbi:MAG: UDP-N-acetylmuramate dehydrogenase [Eubacteriales bacterium]|nr:UDP-N-acetylmuramate dehydrogenase [Eubacteriales bacterium]
MDRQEIKSMLESIVGESGVKIDEPMNIHTTFKIGGVADYFVTPSSVDELQSVITFLKKSDIVYFIIGNGSNLLVSDDGFRGVIIQLNDTFDGCEFIDDTTVEVMAGMLMSRLGNRLAKKGIGGFEFATGIPGTIGGAVRMNAGAYGGEMKDIVVSAKVLDSDCNLMEISADKLEFGYRTSSIVKNNYTVVSVVLKLEKDEPDKIKARIKELSVKRREKQPLEYPSAGSTFKRPEGNFAAKLIEDAGLKGASVGGALVSTKHAGFVVNKGGATAKDVCELTDRIKQEVMTKFGVKLELEVVKLGF